MSSFGNRVFANDYYVRMILLSLALIKYDRCLYKKGEFGQTDMWKRKSIGRLKENTIYEWSNTGGCWKLGDRHGRILL